MKKLIKTAVLSAFLVFSGNVCAQTYLGMEYDAAVEYFKRYTNKAYENLQEDDGNYWIIERDMDMYGNLTGNVKYYWFKPDDDGKWIVVMEEAESFGDSSYKIKDDWFMRKYEKTNYSYMEEVAEKVFEKIPVYYQRGTHEYIKAHYMACIKIKANDGSLTTKFRYYLNDKFFK